MTTPRATDALIVGAVKLLTSALVLAQGFRAVSDDDYARIAIAQRFAEAPSLDPSGTSWLPLPFWVYGGAFSLFGSGLEVARVTALLLGVAAAVAVLVAAQWLGAGRLGALFAAVVASAFPWSAWLGAAALPEAPTAGLIVLGIASLSESNVRRRSLGAFALAVACFSRYEAWPVAFVFLVLTAIDARRLRSWGLAVPAVVAVLPIALWLAHGAVRHDDALFFWKRVAAYKAALGETRADAGAFEPLVAFVREAFLLVLLTCVSLVLRIRSGGIRSLAPYARGAACSAALVAFLSAGAVGGAAPTHHFARALLPVWYFLALVLGHGAEPSLAVRRQRPGFVGVILILFTLLLTKPLPGDFAHRDLELHIGSQAHRLGAPALLVDTSDFGYFAISAAFRKPNATAPVDDHDPRTKRPQDAFASLETLRTRLAGAAHAWLVTTNAHAELASELGAVRARNPRFTLVEPDRRSPR